MKAEEFLESYAISDLDVFGRHEEHYSLDNLLNEYARIQIEKDREAVKDAVHESGLYHNHIGLDKIYKKTPINLD